LTAGPRGHWVVSGMNRQSDRMAEHRKSEFDDTQVPAETAERPGTWAAAGTAYTPAALAALTEAGVAATVAERPPRTALETAARVPLLATTRSQRWRWWAGRGSLLHRGPRDRRSSGRPLHACLQRPLAGHQNGDKGSRRWT
jgi:hypothetical protein